MVMRAASPPQLIVVLDLHMHHGSGFDVIHALAGDNKLAARHRVIVCSAHRTKSAAIGPHIAALLTPLEASDLAKPFDIDELLAKLAQAERALISSLAPWATTDSA